MGKMGKSGFSAALIQNRKYSNWLGEKRRMKIGKFSNGGISGFAGQNASPGENIHGPGNKGGGVLISSETDVQ
jgi:hypothetical protein